MSVQQEGQGDFDQETIAQFSAKLEQYAAGLPEREQRLLLTLLVAAMDPIDRIAMFKGDQLLNGAEEAYLRTL
jgi:hypothetical protein